MKIQITPNSTAADIQADLRLLYVERALAEQRGVDTDGADLADLLDDIAAHVSALTGIAVTEIASLRADLDGPLWG